MRRWLNLFAHFCWKFIDVSIFEKNRKICFEKIHHNRDKLQCKDRFTQSYIPLLTVISPTRPPDRQPGQNQQTWKWFHTSPYRSKYINKAYELQYFPKIFIADNRYNFAIYATTKIKKRTENKIYGSYLFLWYWIFYNYQSS